MTSPTQLKYLEAMGIPVWVSRDLVSFKDANQIDSKNNANNETVINKQESRGVHSNAKSNVKPTNNCLLYTSQSPRDRG